ncbi:hypothetical protein TSUD_95110 [Trifolium subterraneum]|uniref:RNase H type-1 domain-containing protein n=1 Tax=Trifolium subterraneum TaxID=3900 RepID=A0A2Z6LSJ5_TRISU|nr:hypothetical protein TSUD_95110 [Trifolium subterraneum]
MLFHPYKCWNSDIINQLFLPFERDLIKQTPLIPETLEDQLMWPHSKEGIYTVKSGYNLIKFWKNAESPSSTHTDAYNKVWKKLWALPTIPRHKILLWRIIHQALPVRSALSKRGIQCLIQCPRYLQKEETINHVFMNCPHATRIWFGSKLGVRFDQRQGNFSDWIVHAINTLNEEDISYVAAITYSIWFARNLKVFEDKNCEDSWVINKAWVSLKEYQMANTIEQTQNQYQQAELPNPNHNQHTHTTNNRRWTRPSNGIIKINCDANLAREGRWGLGTVCRDSKGIHVAAATWEIHGCSDPTMAEACALYKAMKFAQERGFREVEIESDCSRVIDMVVKSQITPRSYLGNFILGIKCNISFFRKCGFRHIRREANRAAHVLASLAHIEPNKVWLE